MSVQRWQYQPKPPGQEAQHLRDLAEAFPGLEFTRVNEFWGPTGRFLVLTHLTWWKQDSPERRHMTYMLRAGDWLTFTPGEATCRTERDSPGT